MEDSEFYEAIMKRKDKVAIKKWRAFFITAFDPFSNIMYLSIEDAFEKFLESERIKFELLEYVCENNTKHIFTIKSLYTGSTFLLKMQFDYSIT